VLVYAHGQEAAGIKRAAFHNVGAGGGLDADTVDGFQATDLLTANVMRTVVDNGSMELWQRWGTTITAATGPPQRLQAAGRTFGPDRWYVEPGNAALVGFSQNASTVGAGAKARYSALITGGAGVTTVDFGTRIAAERIYAYGPQVVFSCKVKNNTGQYLAPQLNIRKANATNDFSVTNGVTGYPAVMLDKATGIAANIAQGASAWIYLAFDMSGSAFTGYKNGLQVSVQIPTALLVAGKTVEITECQLEVGATPSGFVFVDPQLNIVQCQRYIRKTYEPNTAIGTATTTGQIAFYTPLQGYMSWSMRGAPTVTFYNGNTGAAGEWAYSDPNVPGHNIAMVSTATANGFAFTSSPVAGAGQLGTGHVVADAEFTS
jgi:hypothetical protein